jgi:Ser/Thr protein kinase RdoA (MazF antagonist)
MIAKLIKKYFNIQIADYQLVKTIDTLVFKVQNTEGVCFTAKLYKAHNKALVEKIRHNALFLDFVKQLTNLKIQALPQTDFPLVDWEGEKRYLVLNEWIEGEKPALKDAQLMQKMGKMTAQLHNAASVFPTNIPVLNIDNSLIQTVKFKILARRNQYDFDAKRLDLAFEKMALTYQKAGNDPSVFGLIHSDLHFANVIINDEGELSPIDFDELAYGHYLLDIAITLNEIEDYDDAIFLKENYLNAYLQNRPINSNHYAYTVDFQRIASAIYLNWLLENGNEDLLENKKMWQFGRQALDKILAFDESF